MLSKGTSAISISKRIFCFFNNSPLNEPNWLDNIYFEFNFNLGGELSVRQTGFVLFKSEFNFKIK